MKIAVEKTIKDISEVNKHLNWLDGMICKGLENGPVSIAIGRPEVEEDLRTNQQNAKIWAIFTDMEKQLAWHGQKMEKEDWKDLLCHEWKKQKLVPAISGGFCVLNARTSKAFKREISDLIEISYAFGSSKGIKWSEKSIAVYEEYACNTKHK